MGKLILLDLDGTLTDTAHANFKAQKDGQSETIVENIPIIKGALEFLIKLKELGHIPVIISDSHPKYVDPIAQQLFKIPALSLSDKPNSQKTKEFIVSKWQITNFAEQCLVVGDTWLDIELGRSLNCPTILTTFYKATSSEERDGIGQEWKHIKSGPTYVADSFNRICEIITNPFEYLLAAEAVFCNVKSKQYRKFYTNVSNNAIIAFRSLGRQNAGECDIYGIADKYFEFQRADRTENTIKLLAEAVDNYLNFAIESTQNFKWDLLTYVSDKLTTIPVNKMSQLFNLLKTPIPKEKIFNWKVDIQGSIRDQKHYQERNDFVLGNVNVEAVNDLNDKSVIVIDDQFTTGGTAFAITKLLQNKGVKNILFVTLVHLISNVESEKTCPRCQKRLVVKIRRSDGNRFLSCTPPQYGGVGCGYTSNIQQ
jgi:phosphoglycolate phosphatase-like HAD superfamily hydrolase